MPPAPGTAGLPGTSWGEGSALPVLVLLAPSACWSSGSGHTQHSSEPNTDSAASAEHPCSANHPSPPRPNILCSPDIEFNVTGNYGSPLHVNHNANYSSMPSPDMEHGERRQHDQARRPLSVATDNMMLEFYKKDG